MRATRCVGAILLGAGGATMAAAAPSIEAVAFGGREYIQDISLSPDGTKVAMIQPVGARGSAIAIADLTTGGAPKVILAASGDPERFSDCHWSTNTRLICRVFVVRATSGFRLGLTRMIAINADGSDQKMLSEGQSSRALGLALDGGDVIDWTGGAGNGAAVLMTRIHVPEVTVGTRFAKTKQGLGVDRLDTATLSRVVVEQPRIGAVEYISDGLGAVRVMGTMPGTSSGYSSSEINYFYRKPGGRDWLPLGTLALTGTGGRGFNPYAVDPKSNEVYGFERTDGRHALWRIALDGSMKREMVVSRPDVDVDGLIQIGRQKRVVGASWATERREATFFDPELKALSASLGKALPKKPLVRFVDASADEKRLLMFAGSDDDAGRYYVFDKGSRKLEEILPVRPHADRLKLATMKPVSFPAGDGTMIPAYLTLPAGSDGKGLPAIVMPHGGPGARDEWGFDWLSQFFAAKGFAVLQPNFRGSSGYGEAWFQKNGFQSWRTAIGDVNDGGRWLLSQGIAAPGKLGIVGWSYGGYAAVQSSVLDPDLFKGIVAIAPVTDLDTLRNDSRNYTNFVQVDRFIGTGAHVKEGSPARNIDRIKAPVLLFHGDLDLNVSVGQSRLMADRLKDAGRKVEICRIQGAGSPARRFRRAHRDARQGGRVSEGGAEVGSRKGGSRGGAALFLSRTPTRRSRVVGRRFGAAGRSR